VQNTVRFLLWKAENVLKRLAFILLVSLAGTAALLSLGKWQLDRLHWKQAILDDITDRINAVPVSVPLNPSPDQDKYLPVQASGKIGAEYIRILSSQKIIGAGYRIISPFEIDGRRFLIDRGFLKIADKISDQSPDLSTVQGNLHWPQEVDGFTPEADVENNMWFARDVFALADILKTEPILIVASNISPSDGKVTPLAVDSNGIPNDHLQYAITWFSLAAVWTIMNAAFLWRTRKRTKGKGQ
jgi:surfeit locus 1 family protein